MMNMVGTIIVVVVLGLTLAVISTPGGQEHATQSQLQEKKLYAGLEIEEKSPERKDKLVLSDAEWKDRLTPEQFRIMRGHGTEAPFCSPLNDVHKAGVFYCSACGLPLFSTDAKFTSGTGWPSFFQPVDRNNIWLKSDYTFGMYRVEVNCARCDGHLGHLFMDGPRDKTGLRFCINGESLVFKENDK